ncbi:hypothetical protein EII20_00675 [Comamonadaceae bacterium OH2545_COT-014]|nr:hypothetical protein EII20_00675 [Comamonadaceae bacterium OH2545_COT-014]
MPSRENLWWPFLLAATVTGKPVATYLAGWFGTAWTPILFLTGFPVIHATLVIARAEWDRRRDGASACGKPPPV